MLMLKLALRNILGAGLRTWLNVVALSLAFVVIVFMQGVYEGMNDRAEQAGIDALYGGGQYWQRAYDPFDPLTLEDAHAPIPAELQALIREGRATPILIRQATVYPQGRVRTAFLKGIDPSQTILSIPSSLLAPSMQDTADQATIPAVIGTRMATSMALSKDDELTIQWRDVHGTFDAGSVRIVETFKTTVQEIDNDQVWISLDRLQEMIGMQGEATMVVLGRTSQPPGELAGWEFKDLSFLLQDLHALVRTKSIGGSIFYLFLLFFAMLAIFDTQVLSVWRRRKEIGTLMALGMTRTQVVKLFTLEGALHGVLAALVGAVYGIPLISYVATVGWTLPQATDSFGFALGEKIYPAYTAALVVGTTLLVLIVTTVVSFLPTRKIAKIRPSDALRGRAT